MEGSVIAARSNDLRGARKAPCVRFGGWSGRSGAAADGGLRIARVSMRPIIREFRCPPDRLIAGWQCRDACRTGLRMGDLDRLVPSGIIEQWVYHLRRQRARAADAIWLIDQGFTLHDGHGGLPQHDATARWRTEQEAVVEEVTALLALYDGINLGKTEADLSPDQR